MAITLLSTPQELSPGYNPLYVYASSDNVSNDNFRFLVKVRNQTTSTTLAELKIKPRFGDDYLEINVAKILQGNLGSLLDDLDVNNITEGTNNTESSGYRYYIGIGEEYTYTWSFADTQFESGMVRLVGVDSNTYNVGDQVNVQGAAESFAFTDNNFYSGGYVAFVSPGHTINTGDTVFIQQDPGYVYEAYNGYHEVIATTSTLVVIDLGFQGNTPANPGTLWRNYQYDGLQTVTGTGTVASGPYAGYNYIDLDQAWIDNSPTNPGTVEYWDGRLLSDPELLVRTRHIFNGAVKNDEWLTWDYNEYNPSGIGCKWLTSLPDNWSVSLEDDVMLNIWGDQLSGGMHKAILRTYDSSGTLLGVYEWLTPGSQSEFLNVQMGPNWINYAAGSLSPSPITVVSGPAVPISCPDVAYYTTNVVSALGVEQTDYRTFYLDCDCTGRYTNYPVLFMDRFGSFVPFDFDLNNRQMVDVKRDNYNRFIGDYVSGSTNGYSYSLADHSMRPYNTDINEMWTINTDWMTEAESLFFEELVTSPLALIQIEGSYYAVNVETKTYERKRKNNEKVIRHTLDISFSNNDSVQSL